ncbi:uncharacterized protein isoform X2 [Leptinotarsa decemlineata]|uniref:uncharacterized protein isoform X2 n=1 Tax=Leptinotarsa decemlineata TaxID=7539 RepID=UPI003D304AD3
MIVVTIPVTITIFLLIITTISWLSKNFRRFKEKLEKKPPRITELPIITSTGQIVNTVEDLDMHLDFLKNQLEEKESELETSKAKICSTEENLKRLTDTVNEVRKYFLKLKAEITKNEIECKELQNQIEDYQNRQNRLREEVNENVKYYTGLLSDIDNSDSKGDCTKDYEVIAPTSSQTMPDFYKT